MSHTHIRVFEDDKEFLKDLKELMGANSIAEAENQVLDYLREDLQQNGRKKLREVEVLNEKGIA